MAINSTRRKWFAPGADPVRIDQEAPQPVPEPEPQVDRTARRPVPLGVGTANIGDPRRSGTGSRPNRGNAGRWWS